MFNLSPFEFIAGCVGAYLTLTLPLGDWGNNIFFWLRR
jgi:hypothetical protein